MGALARAGGCGGEPPRSESAADLAAFCARPARRRAPARRRDRLDGASWDYIDPQIAAGRLPHPRA
jgi:hypothetical protein